MSLRKSPQLTPALLAAARRNARHSPGPRSAAAKQNVKLNALMHGAYVRDENRHKTMLALGEDLGDGAAVGDDEEVLDSDSMPESLQVAQAVEDLEMNELCGNVIENKGKPNSEL
jgi:hypothetical protein